jgi:copper chaperone CopZ
MRRFLLAALLALPVSAFAGEKNYDVLVEGMHCAPCVDSVKKALSELPEVDQDSVTVNLKNKKATLTFKSENPTQVEAIKEAVKKAGFKVTAVHTGMTPKKQ